jgi:hypothetical protein
MGCASFYGGILFLPDTHIHEQHACIADAEEDIKSKLSLYGLHAPLGKKPA